MLSLVKEKSSRYSSKVNPNLHTGCADSHATEVNNSKNTVLNFKLNFEATNIKGYKQIVHESEVTRQGAHG